MKVDTEIKSSFLKCISINLSGFVCCSDTKQGRKQKRRLHNILQLYAKVEDSRPENKYQEEEDQAFLMLLKLAQPVERLD